MKCITLIISIAFLLFAGNSFAQEEVDEMIVQKGKEVSISYVLKVDGEIIDTSEKRGPLTYVQGGGKIIPGLSRQIEGMKVGDKKNIRVEPEEAYGKVNPKAFQEIPKSQLPSGVAPQVDMKLQISAPDGRMRIVRISEVREDTVVLDMNHLLAGKKLYFEIEVVSIR